MNGTDMLFLFVVIAGTAVGFLWWQRARLQANPPDVRDIRQEIIEPASVAEADPSPQANPASLIVLHLEASEGQKFVGYDLLQSLLGANLRFGSMSIFHRYGEVDGKSCELFSVAQSKEPGIFDMGQMGAIACSGLTFFMDIERVKDPARVFELMLGTAQDLCDELGGQLLTADRQSLDQAYIDACTARVKANDTGITL